MPTNALAADTRVETLRKALRGSNAEVAPPPGPDEKGWTHAAVSLILRAGPELEALLIRRAVAEGDPWSGHMALPGGRREESDPDLRATAVRETLEETALPLDSLGLPLGVLPTLEPFSRRLPPFAIHPYVFAVPPGTGARVNSREVDEVLWTPLSRLFRGDAEGSVRIPLDEVVRTFPCFRVEDRVVWGLTYRILKSFAGRVEAYAPDLLSGV